MVLVEANGEGQVAVMGMEGRLARQQGRKEADLVVAEVHPEREEDARAAAKVVEQEVAMSRMEVAP